MVNPSANEGEQALAEPAAPPPASRSVAAGEHQPRVVEHTRRRRGRRKAPMYTPKEVALMNYKDVDKLRRLLSDRGRMEPQRKTGLLAKDQRKLAREIKRARQIALLPYTHEHMWVSAQFRQEARAAARAERPPDEPPTAEPRCRNSCVGSATRAGGRPRGSGGDGGWRRRGGRVLRPGWRKLARRNSGARAR